MKRPWLILIVILALGVLTAFLLRTASRIPTYQGQTVYDLMFALKSSGLETSPGFMAIGSNAVPHLAEALRIERTKYDRYAWVRSPWFQKFAARRKLSFTWSKPAADVRHSATFALLAFSFQSRPALPELHAELVRAQDGDRQTVVNCLSELGPLPESIPWLVKAFPLSTNESYVVRHDLLHALGNGGTNAAAQAMPLVVASLRDQEPEVRLMAAQTLARWAQPAPDAIPDLVSMLSSTNESMVMSAAWALGNITNRCDEALPGVRRLLDRSPDDFHRAIAAMALWHLGGDAGETRRVLEGLLRSKRGKGVAANSLEQMGPAAKSSVPELLKAAHENIEASFETYDRAQCAKAVLRLQGETPEMYPVLEEAIITEKNSWSRATVIEQIAQIGPSARPLVPVLQRALNDPQRDVRHEAAVALEKLKHLR
jgi:HEAT repeat protein